MSQNKKLLDAHKLDKLKNRLRYSIYDYKKAVRLFHRAINMAKKLKEDGIDIDTEDFLDCDYQDVGENEISLLEHFMIETKELIEKLKKEEKEIY